jgi:hypothetical protein
VVDPPFATTTSETLEEPAAAGVSAVWVNKIGPAPVDSSEYVVDDDPPPDASDHDIATSPGDGSWVVGVHESTTVQLSVGWTTTPTAHDPPTTLAHRPTTLSDVMVPSPVPVLIHVDERRLVTPAAVKGKVEVAPLIVADGYATVPERATSSVLCWVTPPFGVPS